MIKKVTYQIISIVIFFGCILQPQASVAQWVLDVAGTIKKEETKKRMSDATIIIKRNGAVFKTLTPDENGKFEVELPSDAVYVVEFSKPGHVSKRIEISTENVPPDDAKYGLDFAGFNVSLFEEIEGLDVSILDQPIAKIAFDDQIGYMDYDADYTKSIKKELERLKEELEERLKALEEERLAKQKDYDEAIGEGDKSFNAEKWGEAKPHYERALSIFPKEAYPQEQLAEIEAQLGKSAATEKAYADAISEADALFSSKKWDESVAAYEKALTIKTEEKYPKDQIEKIAEIKANADKFEKEYAEAISKADQFFGENDYEKAKENYTKASELKDEEEYPKIKLKEIDELLLIIAGKENGYNDAIDLANKQFEGKEYQKAIDSYNKALTFKSEEEYPKEKIVEANKLIESLKLLKEDYDKLILAADDSFKKSEYDKAKTSYEEASALLDNEQYPKDQLLEIEKILGDAAKLEENYGLAIAQGDKAFGEEAYETAQIEFEKALELKPAEEYPKEKLEEIKIALKELAAKKAEEDAASLAQKEIDEKYNAFIASADNSFNNKDYAKASDDYNSALTIKKEDYPNDKLEEIENILAELERQKEADKENELAQKELNDKYNAFVADADAAMVNEEFDNAVENYKQAIELKEDEQYPKEKIKEIEDLLAAIEKKGEEEELAAESERKKREYFDALVAEADAELSSENYSEAESKFKQALIVIPGEKYPEEKLAEIEVILARIKAEKDNSNLAQKELDDNYKKLVDDGDALFSKEDYDLSMTKYKEALKLKDEEVYPQDQLDKIEQILAEKESEITINNNALKQKQEQYDSFVEMADKELLEMRYREAISIYEQALSIMPNKVYPKTKIDEINQTLKSNAEKDKNEKEAALAEEQKREAYLKLISDGDKDIDATKYKEAQGKFNAALSLYPDEKYPSKKLAEILELLKEKPKKEEDIVAEVIKGSRLKIDDKNERAIEARMAALLNKRNSSKIEALKKDRVDYANQEEIRVSGNIDRTEKAGEGLSNYTDQIITRSERGDKYHIENFKSLSANATLLNKAEKDRIRLADNRRAESEQALAVYVKDELEFVKEQEERSKDKVDEHNIFIEEVTETNLVMVERGNQIGVKNKIELDRVAAETKKIEIEAKKRSIESEMDVHKYRASLTKQEEIRVAAAINRTNKNEESINKLAQDIKEQSIKNSNSYKLNVEELIKFRNSMNKLEEERVERADKARFVNQKLKKEIETDLEKKALKHNQRYYKDVKKVAKIKNDEGKLDLLYQKKADKRRTQSNRRIIASKNKLGEIGQGEEKRNKVFKETLDMERKANNEFLSELQNLEKKRTLLANNELGNFYVAEKKPREDNELAKKYAQGITEEIAETGSSVAITRIKVTGTQADVYERIFYNWGGVFFYKNGINITKALWDKESIE